MSVTYKTVEEMSLLQEGGRRHARMLRELARLVRSGVSTLHLENVARQLIKDGDDNSAFLGYQPENADRPFPAVLCVSVNDEIVHGIPNEPEKILREGDIVKLDLGLNHKGMITDAAITIPVGVITKEAARLIQATKEALDAGIAVIRPGGHVGDIGAAVERVAKKYGYAIAEGLTGHGVGYAVHEDPYVLNTGKVGTGEELLPGMVFAIEPMFTTGKGAITLDPDGYTYRTKDGSLAAHFEHTVAVVPEGVLIFTEAQGA